MKFTIGREDLLKSLQAVAGAVEKKQTMPILGNVLFDVRDELISLTATDTEVELLARTTSATVSQPGQFTAPARKIIDICRSLPEKCELVFSLKDERVSVKSGRSRFSLLTLPVEDFPCVEDSQATQEFTIQSTALLKIFDLTSFSMAVQDVRYYLNGVLLVLKEGELAAVSTDGHRLACAQIAVENLSGQHQVIIPRKGVLELQRVLGAVETPVGVSITANHLRVDAEKFTFTSKLIDGKYPDYQRVIPTDVQSILLLEREVLRDALSRVSILSNEKNRGVRLFAADNKLRISANNPEQEEAEEELALDYADEPVDIGFNVSYLLDVLSVLPEGEIQLSVKDNNSSSLVESPREPDAFYVVMPMRI